ncbi:CRISPR-associated endonuclease Cas1 [Jeotgalicoccus aerolatus]|uniref:CRISPR-associated endonuclease Cas1 n=1 Tax=Jeotgalicoccus aerolatus TaxID=709510 RepID=A0ABS4HQA5_9STAP|nr:type II CRISPR-associated endonuclease Cas1 [Jeotgalicoccus aerolatus]MBP1952993.1 CRISPR-associated protein Cas1 [Jeotgalicoccus aerolatus]GGE01683.1 CRISPR-associated endonuclease Cas1 [Jeotgalicoccus aerolatus]CAD2073132.1 CRISPR-associated endonuclease Cas1 [Jeotgalicoccus aerolatus]
MSFRTVLLSKDSKISLRMNHLVVKSDKLNHIPLTEIGVLLIENPNISMSGHILNALANSKILTILCDKNHMPCSVVESVYGHHRQSKNIKKQINWNPVNSKRIWQLIIKEKISHQGRVLKSFYPEFDLESFTVYADTVEINDMTNREGHAAKVYFRQLFGEWFIRSFDDEVNAGLNYGYSLISATFSRIIKSKGYLTELGVNHTSEFNHHNLSSDLMEVFRPLVDRVVFENIEDTFDKEEKRVLLDIFNAKILINGKRQYFLNAVDIYVDSIFKYLETGNENYIKFPIWDK